MKLKYFYISVLSIIIIALNFVYGSIISYFLSATIIACLYYFGTKLGFENVVHKSLEQVKKEDTEKLIKLQSFNNKWRALLSFGLLTIVFISAIVAVVRTTNPVIKPWFLNNEYHSLSNSGIAFNKNLKFNSGKTENNVGSINIQDLGAQKTQLMFDSFYEPVVLIDNDRKQHLLNNIFAQDLGNQFSIGNAQNKIDIQLDNHKANFFSDLLNLDEDQFIYTIKVHSTDAELLSEYNINAPFDDVITIKTRPMDRGMSLFNHFLDAKHFESTKPEAYQVLEALLGSIKNSYFIVDNTKEDGSIKLFPDQNFFTEGFQLSINNQLQKAQLSNSSSIAYGDQFYIGFNNYKYLLSVDTVSNSNYGLQKSGTSLALLFDYPNMYMLKSPGEQKIGNKNIRFITTDFDKIIDTDLKEGFYFTNYNLVIDNKISGNIDYVSGAPNVPLQVAVTDNNVNGKHFDVTNQKFHLTTNDNNVNYLFDIRDFSKSGFSYDNIVIYLTLTYLIFVILTVFFPGKRIDRIEPIVLSVIFALTTLRYIMYWRVATFPPLEQISKHELEQTLINFDFNLGVQLPIPLTLIWTALFVIFIIIYRTIFKNGKAIPYVEKWESQITTHKALIRSFAIFMGVCLVAYLVNKKVTHIEIITRFVTIIIPLLAYCYYSILANKKFDYQPMPLNGQTKKWQIELKAYVYYFVSNPTFMITIITICFFGVCDRGFAILFTLFILLKNIFLNFLKKPFRLSETKIGKMLSKPNNYWIYGVLCLIVYLITLAFKPLFYYFLTYKLLVILALGLLTILIIYILHPTAKKALKITSVGVLLFGALIAIPTTRGVIDHQLNDVVKHVQYRASLIHQPISDLLQENEYASFKTRKIIETAENQWFINSYIDKEYDSDAIINLRPYTRVGVDYPTQTRDVVIARFVISELGNFTMYLILLVMLMPLVLYLISYQLNLVTNEKEKRDIGTYAGLVPLIILFTIALFVWLTATNRFVFFGQDFPFLSLTSKMSVLLPLMLYAIVLMQQPTYHSARQINLKGNAIKYGFFFGLIAVFALTTIKKNELNNTNFTVVMDTTKQHIDVDLNNILSGIQDSISNNGKKITYTTVIQALAQSKAFDSLKNQVVKDPYTKSVLENLITKPSTALQLNNPLFMTYDNGRYESVYNKNLYLELPPIENRKIWNGSISEQLKEVDQYTSLIKYKDNVENIALPYFINDVNNSVQFAVLPGSWFGKNGEPVGLLNINNSARNSAKVFLYKNRSKNLEQSAISYVNTIENEDFATIYKGNQSFGLSFQNAGHKFATNKWVNGKYKVIYPMKKNNFWIYNFSNAVKSGYSNDNDLIKNVKITLDYALTDELQNIINQKLQPEAVKNIKYDFSVMGADGNGNVRFMNDFIANKRILDPNDEAAIFALQQQQFFFSNAKNERDQWGNRNLLHLYLGPGSSIKPLFAGIVSAEVNAGWENLWLQPATAAELDNYGGLKLFKKWKNDEHYHDLVNIPKYIEVSSNFYQSIMVFLGSYSKQRFEKEGVYSLDNILTSNAGSNNTYPAMIFNGQKKFMPNLKDAARPWPITDKSKKNISYFGNENSILANGFEMNANLRTKDKDKQDLSPASNDKVRFTDSTLYTALNKSKSGGFLWSFPEESFFLQSNRDFNEIQQNLNLGLKTTTLGGYPYQLTPFKMVEMYTSMLTQNRNLKLQIVNQKYEPINWQIDSTWGNNTKYKIFLAENIFKGMNQVIFGASGTAKRLSGLKTQYPQYHFYAKTGTINEQTSSRKSSRRLYLAITNKDLTDIANIGNTKVYSLYFAVDNAGDFNWELINQIVSNTIASKSFQYYFNQ